MDEKTKRTNQEQNNMKKDEGGKIGKRHEKKREKIQPA